MAISAKARNCFTAVTKLKDDEVTELLDRSSALRSADPSLSEDTALLLAVRELIGGLRGNTAARGDVIGGMAADLTNQPTKTQQRAVERKLTRTAQDDFSARVEAARSAGDINQNQADDLNALAAAGDERSVNRAKDELLRYREEADERRQAEAPAAAKWNDPEYNWSGGDPMFGDLTPAAREKWTAAVKAGRDNGALYEQLVAETRGAEGMPDMGSEGEIRTGTDSTRTITNSDRRRTDRQVIDTSNPDMLFGRTAVAWLAENATDPWLRALAQRLEPYIDADVTIEYLKPGQKYTLPTNVARQFSTMKTFGLSVVDTATGKNKLYFRDDPDIPVGVEDMLHELLHSATQRGLTTYTPENAKARTELIDIARMVRSEMGTLAYMSDDPKTKNDATFFNKVIDSPDELLAYAFTSHTLREFLKGMNAKGEFKGPREDSERRSVEREAERRAGAEPELTLWQKLVDAVRRLFGIDAKYAPQLEEMLDRRAKQVQAFITKNMAPDLYQRLDKLLQTALDTQASTDRETWTQTFIEAPKAQPSTQRVEADVPGLNLPDFEPGSPFATRMKDWAGGWRNKPSMLGWLTLRQMADRFKDIPGVAEFAELSQRMSTKAKALMGEAHKIDQEWATLAPDEQVEMQKLMLESTMEGLWPDRALTADAHRQLDKADPGIRAKHAALANRYSKLSDKAKRVFVNAQAKMRKDWTERGELLARRIVDQYRPELDRFAGARLDSVAKLPKRARAEMLKTVTRNEAKSLNALWSDMDAHNDTLAQMQGPYFPLVRFGQHAVVAKSQDYLSAADTLQRNQEALQKLNDAEQPDIDAIEAAREKVKLSKAALEGLKDNERHYVVEFYESPSEAVAREQQLKAFYKSKNMPMRVYSQRREDHFQSLDAASPAFMKKLESALSANLPDKDAAAIRAAVRDLYIQSMPERSALKSQLRRLNVRGVKAAEMRRAFAAAAMRNSWHLSRLEYGPAMQEELNNLRTGESDEQKVVGGELAKRLVASFQQDEPNLLLERLSNLSYLTYLGMSPSFFVLNAAQPWVVSAPIMAAKYGIKRTTQELGSAFGEVGAAMKASAQDQKTWRFELNLEKFSNEDERRMLSDLFNKGIIDVTIEHDLGSIASGQEATRFGKVMQLATLPAHHTEVVNRVMTALAAYRMAKADGSSSADATNYAEKVVADTHLDYTPENAPRLMRSQSLGGLGRLVFQFKKYMQGMVFLLGKLSLDASRGDKEAGKALVYLMGAQLGVAGASGLPIAAPVGFLLGAVAKMWPDDDEPEIAELAYQGMKDALGETLARALVKGLPAAAGVDISGRIGMGNILNPVAYAQSGKEGKDWAAAQLLALAGPAASMAANWAEAVSVAKDDPLKALQMAAPKAIADPIRALDRADRGVTSRKGDTLIAPEEFGPLGLAMRAAGFESTDVTDMYQKRAAYYDAKSGRDDTRKRLIRDWVNARLAGGDAGDAASEIRQFNMRHSDNRIAFKNLAAALKQAREEKRNMRGGLQVRKSERQLAAEFGE